MRGAKYPRGINFVKKKKKEIYNFPLPPFPKHARDLITK